ncbi:MAG TPA: D-alanine--D-alanine ligase, partial [Candidatus Omnitrophota bacterium]|nr:D-alanine--D-alanine ligase [Candidatus Omnitrophota bacterium]
MDLDHGQFGRIGVLMGGCSSEREVSLKSGKAVFHALEEAGCDVVPVDLTSFDPGLNKRVIKDAGIELAFITLHGVYGEDGQIQSLLEEMGIPYIGSGVEANRIAIDKIQTQFLLKKEGVPVSEFCVVQQEDGPCGMAKACAMAEQGTVVVKPACEGSSIGVEIVHEIEKLAPAVEQALGYGSRVLIERYITGREFTAGILGGEALPIVEIRPKAVFFDFQAKYQKGMTEYIVPAQIDQELSRKIQGIALKVFHAIGCRDLA